MCLATKYVALWRFQICFVKEQVYHVICSKLAQIKCGCLLKLNEII